MLKVASYDIVFQEVPGEVTLALNLSGCPYRCAGCHSPHLREDIGQVADEGMMDFLLDKYGPAITCVCFMGGDGNPEQVWKLARHIRTRTGGGLRTAWYSGRDALPHDLQRSGMDYIKTGPYMAHLGGLRSPNTNQRLYRIMDGRPEDITSLLSA